MSEFLTGYDEWKLRSDRDDNPQPEERDVDEPEESRYPVRWSSASRGCDITLEEMHTTHLLNAYAKLNRILKGAATTDPTALFMAEEIRRRGVEVPS